MKLSIIIPAYNEEKTISKVISRVENAKLGNIKKEIIVVDDFSRDGTRKLLERLQDHKLKIFFHEKNNGKVVLIPKVKGYSTTDFIKKIADLHRNN